MREPEDLRRDFGAVMAQRDAAWVRLKELRAELELQRARADKHEEDMHKANQDRDRLSREAVVLRVADSLLDETLGENGRLRAATGDFRNGFASARPGDVTISWCLGYGRALLDLDIELQRHAIDPESLK